MRSPRTSRVREPRSGSEHRVRSETTDRQRQRHRVAGRHEKRVATVFEQLRAAGVSAVTSAVAVAIAWKALFGITRPVFSDMPKIPSAQPASGTAPEGARTPPTIRRTLADLDASTSSSCPLPTRWNSISGQSAAAPRIASRPCSGISFPTKSTVNCRTAVGRVETGRRLRRRSSVDLAPPSSSKRSTKWRACAAVSATTRSAPRNAFRSIARRAVLSATGARRARDRKRSCPQERRAG